MDNSLGSRESHVLMDTFMPTYHFNGVHSLTIRAGSREVFQALKLLTLDEMPLFRLMFGIRSVPRHVGVRSGRLASTTQPLFEQMRRLGFVLLGEITNQEIVVGTIGQFWKVFGADSPPLPSGEAFIAFDRLGYAKAALNFHLGREDVEGMVRVDTETRVRATDPIALRRFAAYWRLVSPFSAVSRRVWLKAIKRSVERGWSANQTSGKGRT